MTLPCHDRNVTDASRILASHPPTRRHIRFGAWFRFARKNAPTVYDAVSAGGTASCPHELSGWMDVWPVFAQNSHGSEGAAAGAIYRRGVFVERSGTTPRSVYSPAHRYCYTTALKNTRLKAAPVTFPFSSRRFSAVRVPPCAVTRLLERASPIPTPAGLTSLDAAFASREPR